ncbi:HAD-IB family hydrolase [Sphingomonas sp. KRR8]|uniref:HAD family hydrolase n=1 Tax=Sphingomonas sp. KRR8 TaxID=2942996 RepID=UPI00202283D0|nr:HAD-IB family hydrolase [Sphingomonas sp. KRR8]URD59973.1 HAD-IB family hydrolase [Sphingomonas sp. KRR8]
MTDLAVYDMDRTVTVRATYSSFLLHCARRRQPWRLALTPLAVASMLGYVAKAISRARLKEINHALMLGGHIHPHELKPLVESFADRTIANNICPGARQQIARDKAEGFRLVLATASYRLYAEAIADRLGFDDVVATGTVISVGETLAARIDGENCYGPAKKRMLDLWLSEEAITPGTKRFYSDHISDLPVFEWADEPVAVNPHPPLRRLAQQRGWPVENWR